MNSQAFQTISVAVLPFQNLSSDPNIDFFAIGFVEDLIYDLSRFSVLQVISHHSSQTIGNFETEKDEVLENLGADYFVVGSFRLKGQQLRISTQLITSTAQNVMWANRYDAELGSVFEIQDDIIEQIVSRLQNQIDINLLMGTRKKKMTNLLAYECWLRGMEQLKTGTLENDLEARKYFELALENDPHYARAYTGLSLSYFNEWSCQIWELWDESQNGAYKYAKKAIELDENDHMSLLVLGRIYVYKGDFEKGEHFLRKSLKINSNDTDTLIPIAASFVFLGYAKEAETLYKKVLRLNPVNTDWYYSVASFIYFELGEFEKCLELGQKVPLENVWVDMSVFWAGASFALGDKEKAEEYWHVYLELFQIKIAHKRTVTEKEALTWVIENNPYRLKSNIDPYFAYKKEQIGTEIKTAQATHSPQKTEKEQNVFALENNLRHIEFEGVSSTLPDVKGFHDLVQLLSQPSKELHCMELMGSKIVSGEIEFVMDEKAKSELRKKLENLQEELEEAEMMSNADKAFQLQKEYDELVEHISKSMGLGGKSRKVQSPVEKARSAVTWRIRSAIKKIEKAHPALGKHLGNSISTGTFCSYSPEKPVDWDVS